MALHGEIIGAGFELNIMLRYDTGIIRVYCNIQSYGTNTNFYNQA